MSSETGVRQRSSVVAERSVLAITSTPDDRDSTEALEQILHEFERRGVPTHLWYLRKADHQATRNGTRVVDSLRTWPPCAALDTIGLSMVAAWIRGRRMRRWLNAANPSVVILDDGLGARVTDPLPTPPPFVVRLNPEPPEDLHLEGPPLEHAELFITAAGVAPPNSAEAEVYVEHPFANTAARVHADPDRRSATRRALGLPLDAMLVTGWGDEGWLDGPDLFLRTLWALQHRHGRVVHGVWFGATSDASEAARLSREAERLGLADRFHRPAEDTMAGRLCGDAVLLPYRSTASVEDVRDALLSGALVVTFEAAQTHLPLIRVVPDLDVEAAAEALHKGLEEDRDERWRSARQLVDVAALADRVLALAD